MRHNVLIINHNPMVESARDQVVERGEKNYAAPQGLNDRPCIVPSIAANCADISKQTVEFEDEKFGYAKLTCVPRTWFWFNSTV